MNALTDIIFESARSLHKFHDRPVTDETLRALYDLVKLGPTSANGGPGRFVFVRSPEAKERLKPALSSGNRDKTMAAPVTVICAYDLKFHEQLPRLNPNFQAASWFTSSPERLHETAFRNGTLQGAYLIIAARALGLTAGPMSGFDNTKVDAEFFAANGWRSNFLCNLGYGDPSELKPRLPRLSFDEACEVL